MAILDLGVTSRIGLFRSHATFKPQITLEGLGYIQVHTGPGYVSLVKFRPGFI